MNFWTLIRRSLRYHARAHAGVLLGAAVGTAALVGALVVGDSVRASLKELALLRLGCTVLAMATHDRFFRTELAREMWAQGSGTTAVMQLPGTATAVDATARANHVQVLGVDASFWGFGPTQLTAGTQPDEILPDTVWLNEPLAGQLHAEVGDTVLVRVQKPSQLSRDAPLTPQEDSSVAMRLRVGRIVGDWGFGRFSLQANQVAPMSAFINRNELGLRIGLTNRANLLLTHTAAGLPERLKERWRLADAELEVRALPDGGAELRTDRVFLDAPAVAAGLAAEPDARPLLTYFVNELAVGNKSTPYSMVTAMGAPHVPADLADDEIILNDWLAGDLAAKVGDTLRLKYFVIGLGRVLEERTNAFRVKAIVPLAGPAGDRTLMPEFPGLARAETSRDWDAGFPIQLNRIRDQDEKYWHDHRGTPKAFVNLAAGRRMWANRFGDLTALRFPAGSKSVAQLTDEVRAKLDPAALGLSFLPVREQALAASEQSMDFGGLFIGFSFFLIVAALLLMALLFQFGLEQRATEIGTLLALGFRPRQVRRMLLAEGAVLAQVGGLIGVVGGVAYARLMLYGLTTVWSGAVGGAALQFHCTALTLVIGLLAGMFVGVATIWLALRRQARRPARELMAEGAAGAAATGKVKVWWRRRGTWLAVVAGGGALAMVADAIRRHDTADAETFFSAGMLLLIGGLGAVATFLAPSARAVTGARMMTLGGLGLRAGTRRRSRSLATVALLACGVFLVMAIGAFQLDANPDATRRSAGTGGFALIGESALPVTGDLNTKGGRDFYGLSEADAKDVATVSFRVRDGDDASCLNLNRAQKPRLLGVRPEALAERGAFTFAEVAKGLDAKKSWLLLKRPAGMPTNEIPAIGDENSILWALGKKVGDTVEYTDEQGREFHLRLVGAVANSVLQGNLVIDEAEFIQRYPGESGYRMFLLDAPSNSVAKVTAAWTRSLQDSGLELTPAAVRLNAFNAVQNTYLSTFQVLGGLGLLLGSAGLGVVVLRNVQERRGELGLLVALGFRRRALHWLVLSEHGALLAFGLIVGTGAAALAVTPALLSPGAALPFGTLGLTLTGILLNGLGWAWLATRHALRGRLLDALRNDG